MEELYFNKPMIKDFEKIKTALRKTVSDERSFRKVLLACEEIFVNIASYSKAQSLQVGIEGGGGRIIVTFSDDGLLFAPTEHCGHKGFSELDTGGMGISIVRDTVEKMQYKRVNERNILKLIFRG